jgi:hypothetical protein
MVERMYFAGSAVLVIQRRAAEAETVIPPLGDKSDTLKRIVESDLVYLLVLAVLLYSKQLQIAFSGTSF